MKNTPTPNPLSSGSPFKRLAWLPCALLPLAAQAANGTWTGNANALWNAGANWQGGVVADGAGFTATIDRSAFTGTRTISLDAPRTVGSILFVGSAAATRNALIGTAGDGRTLTLDNNGSASLISHTAWGGSTINVSNLALANDLNLVSTPVQPTYLTINSTISSTGGLRTITTLPSGNTPAAPNDYRIVLGGDVTGQVAIRHTSGNNLNLQDSAKTFTGGLNIQSGAVRVNVFGNSGLGGAGNVITFEARDESAAPAVLELHGATSEANATVDKAVVLAASGVVSVASDVGRAIDWTGVISGAGDFVKAGAGTLKLGGANTYTGATRIAEGTLELGASNVLADASAIEFAGGSLAVGAGFSDTVGTLALGSDATIVLGAGSSLAFAGSSGQDWSTFGLSISGDFIGGFSLRFGSDQNGLSALQLGKISVNGVNGWSLDSNGFLTAVPEPSAAAVLGGLAALASVSLRRRRR